MVTSQDVTTQIMRINFTSTEKVNCPSSVTNKNQRRPPKYLLRFIRFATRKSGPWGGGEREPVVQRDKTGVLGKKNLLPKDSPLAWLAGALPLLKGTSERIPRRSHCTSHVSPTGVPHNPRRHHPLPVNSQVGPAPCLGGGGALTLETVTGPSCPASQGWLGRWCGPAAAQARCGWGPRSRRQDPAATGWRHWAHPAGWQPDCWRWERWETGQRWERLHPGAPAVPRDGHSPPTPCHTQGGWPLQGVQLCPRTGSPCAPPSPPPAEPGLAAGLRRLPGLLVGVVQACLFPGAVLDGGPLQIPRLRSCWLQPFKALGREGPGGWIWGLWGRFWRFRGLCR